MTDGGNETGIGTWPLYSHLYLDNNLQTCGQLFFLALTHCVDCILHDEKPKDVP